MNAQQWMDGAAARMRADGSEVSSAQLPGGLAMLGYQSKFKVQWMATKLHLFTVVFPLPVVTAAVMDAFATDALQFAVNHKGGLRGMQVGVAAIPVLVGDRIEPDAIEFAEKKLVRRFGAFAWPAAVDASTGATHSHQGAVYLGGVYSKWMRKRTHAVLGS
jgi:hypothetical protein